jgi:hypothetical protein
MKKMTPNLMHTSSEKNACKSRSECFHVKLQTLIHFQEARAQNKLHKDLWANLFRVWLLWVETRTLCPGFAFQCAAWHD